MPFVFRDGMKSPFYSMALPVILLCAILIDPVLGRHVRLSSASTPPFNGVFNADLTQRTGTSVDAFSKTSSGHQISSSVLRSASPSAHVPISSDELERRIVPTDTSVLNGSPILHHSNVSISTTASLQDYERTLVSGTGLSMTGQSTLSSPRSWIRSGMSFSTSPVVSRIPTAATFPDPSQPSIDTNMTRIYTQVSDLSSAKLVPPTISNPSNRIPILTSISPSSNLSSHGSSVKSDSRSDSGSSDLASLTWTSSQEQSASTGPSGTTTTMKSSSRSVGESAPSASWSSLASTSMKGSAISITQSDTARTTATSTHPSLDGSLTSSVETESRSRPTTAATSSFSSPDSATTNANPSGATSQRLLTNSLVASTNTEISSEPPLLSIFATYTYDGHSYTTQFPGKFQGPIFTETTIYTLGKTMTLPVIMGGAMSTPLVITDTNILTTTLDSHGPGISAKATSLSQEWISASVVIEAWRSDPVAAKHTVAVEGIGGFINAAGRVLVQFPRGNDDSDKQKDSSCQRSGINLPFIGPILNTVKCVIDMASDIRNTISNGIDDAVRIREAIIRTSAQLANILPVMDQLAKPVPRNPINDPPDHPSKPALPTSTEDEGRSSRFPQTSTSSLEPSSPSHNSVSSRSIETSHGLSISSTPVSARSTLSSTSSSTSSSSSSTCVASATAGTSRRNIGSNSCVDTSQTPPCSREWEEPTDMNQLSNTTFGELPQPSGSPTERDMLRFFQTELLEAQKEHISHVNSQPDDHESYNFVPHGVLLGAGVSSAIMRTLGSFPIKFGVINLYGCTSVIAVSELAFWVSHFWELPSFVTPSPSDPHIILHDPPTFARDVLDKITNPLANRCLMGRRPGEYQSFACEAANGNFDGDTNPEFIILTPRAIPAQPHLNPDPQGPNYNTLKYGAQISRIVGALQTTMAQRIPNYSINTKVTIVDYEVRSPPDAYASPPEDGGWPLLYQWAQGKFLLEYDGRAKPGMDAVRKRQAGIQLWAEGRPVPAFQKFWNPRGCQRDLMDPMDTISQGSNSPQMDIDEHARRDSLHVRGPDTCKCFRNACGSQSTNLATTTVSFETPIPATSMQSVVPPSPAPAPPPPPPSKFAGGKCRIHIREHISKANFGTTNRKDKVAVSPQVFDGSNKNVYDQQETETWWGNTVAIPADKLPMDYGIGVYFDWNEGADDDWKFWVISVQIGEHLTNMNYLNTDRSRMPYCEVGDWDVSTDLFQWLDHSPSDATRDADCYWTC
ncbi:hypothetical protein K491DRAFT_679895 [Lophiostoma macrostomum CBS 122681]|uniref:Uncharacterized protein n=1 Tax=Lophiostoma macrostomum CBS 122681 TaxID=1314788 RepID=A0A6A6T293_9PLEO|nr:hypothetical protein K491DRAFT_679895 [Lophiostoma macrostomum CBS 122681]